MTDTKKPEFPKSISIMGQPFRIRQIPNFTDADDGNELAGDCIGDYFQIRINSDYDLSKKWRTLLHEYIHGCLFMNGVHYELPDHMEEIIVQTLEQGIVQFMRKHGKVFLAAIDGDV